MHAKDAVRSRHHPINKRGLLKVWNAVETRGDIVTGGEHIAGDLRLDGVDVVHEPRGTGDAYEEDKASCGDDDSASSKSSTSTSDTCSVAGSSIFQRFIHINNTMSPHNW